MNGRMTKTALLACSMLAAAACMSSPRDGTSATSTDQLQEFSGYVPELLKGSTVNVEVRSWATQPPLSCEDGGTWQSFATATAATTPSLTDACGEKWYAWKVTKRLKNTRQHWCQFYPPSTDLMQAQYRARVGSNTLKSFAADANTTCQPSSQCGFDVTSQCGASDGVAHIYCVSTSCQVKL